jgi:hypothetical protein
VKDGIDWQKFPISWKNCKQMKSSERLLIPAVGREAALPRPVGAAREPALFLRRRLGAIDWIPRASLDLWAQGWKEPVRSQTQPARS